MKTEKLETGEWTTENLVMTLIMIVMMMLFITFLIGYTFKNKLEVMFYTFISWRHELGKC